MIRLFVSAARRRSDITACGSRAAAGGNAGEGMNRGQARRANLIVWMLRLIQGAGRVCEFVEGQNLAIAFCWAEVGCDSVPFAGRQDFGGFCEWP